MLIILAGERLTVDDGLHLYETPDLNAASALANSVRERMNGDTTYYVRNQHINYTNVCNKGRCIETVKQRPAELRLSLQTHKFL